MRSATLKHGVVGGAMLGAAAAGRADNILVNPGFETGDLSGWSVVTGSPGTSTSSYAGDYALSLSALGFSATEEEVRQTFEPVATEDILEVSFWGVVYSGSCAGVLGYSDGTSEGFAIVGGGPWVQRVVTGLLDEGKSLEYIGVRGITTGGIPPGFPGGPLPGELSAGFDDFVVSVVPSPGSLALLLVGSGLLARRSRACP